MARILITGCSTGIGRASAVELTARGHEVIATARRIETIEDLEVAEHFVLDVEDEATIDAAIGASGHIDAVVNNAGFGIGGPIEMVPLEDVRHLFETNFFGAVRVIQAVLPRFRQHGGGVVVNVSSVAGRVSHPLGGYYAASKFALEAVSEALHYEVGHFGIRVVIIEPGEIATHFESRVHTHGVDTPPYDELFGAWEGSIDSLRGGEPMPGPEVVARAIADAIEDDSTPLRVPVGTDASLVVSTRASLDDAAFEVTMREALGLDW